MFAAVSAIHFMWPESGRGILLINASLQSRIPCPRREHSANSHSEMNDKNRKNSPSRLSTCIRRLVLKVSKCMPFDMFTFSLLPHIASIGRSLSHSQVFCAKKFSRARVALSGFPLLFGVFPLALTSARSSRSTPAFNIPSEYQKRRKEAKTVVFVFINAGAVVFLVALPSLSFSTRLSSARRSGPAGQAIAAKFYIL
jgi:hypothetical protein